MARGGSRAPARKQFSSLNTNQQGDIDASLQPRAINSRQPRQPNCSEPIHGTSISKKKRSSLNANRKENTDGSSQPPVVNSGQPHRPEPIHSGSMSMFVDIVRYNYILMNLIFTSLSGKLIGEPLPLVKKKRSTFNANWERDMDGSTVPQVVSSQEPNNPREPHLSDHVNSGSTSGGASIVGGIAHSQDSQPPAFSQHVKKTRGSTYGVKPPKPGQKKVKVRVLVNTLVPIQARTKIGPIIKQHYTKPITSWKKVEKKDVDLMWGEYLKYFRFDSPKEEARGRRVWEKIISRNYAKYLHSWKKAAEKKYGSVTAARNHKPGWTSLEVWRKLCDYWLSDAFLKASALRKTNRASNKGIPHTSGNITYEERQIELFNKLGRPPTQFETFGFTHMVEKEDGTQMYANDASADLAEDYANKLREKHGLAPGAPVNAIEDHGLEAWQECVGGVTRGRLIGRPGERWSKTGVSREYDTHVDSQESSRKWKKLEKDNQKKAKREANLYSFIADQNSYISEQSTLLSSMSQYMQALAEKCGMPAPPPLSLRPPPTPPPFTCSTDDASAASDVPDDPFSPCLGSNRDENDDNDDNESESDDD